MQSEICNHEWEAYSCALCPPSISVQCTKCKKFGHVTNHTMGEWTHAFYACDNYPWPDAQRVIHAA